MDVRPAFQDMASETDAGTGAEVMGFSEAGLLLQPKGKTCSIGRLAPRGETNHPSVIPTGQWSEPSTCGRMTASVTWIMNGVETPK